MTAWLQVWAILFHGLLGQAFYPFPGPRILIDPPPLSGMLVWWAADFGSNCSGACTDGASQSTWADQSGNSNNGGLNICGTAGVYHTNQINGKPAVTFNGNSGSTAAATCYATPTTLDNKSTTTMVAVARFAAGPGVELTLGAGGTSAFRWEGNGLGGGSNLFGIFQGSASNIGFDSAASVQTWFQANVTYNSSTGAYAFRLNRATDGSGTNAKSITANFSNVGINQAGGSINTLNGQVAEFILYNRVLSAGEITTVETYLNSRYGL